ncbi:MAG: hypothetical protein AB7I27_14800 [Bacteriovoracaceae bacterium]
MKKLMFVILFSLLNNALACSCYPHYESKKYFLIKDTWYGSKIGYTCAYECEADSLNELVIGEHVKRIYGEEQGNEIVCDGTIYVETYSSVLEKFIWEFKEARSFNPRRANSKTLRIWAKENCQ